jgi:hypothetical protein
MPGELYIAGIGLARGYLNTPALTAEKFVADPFSREAGARLYKTGDRARYRRDGAIEFCGRIDDQVKIRGFRIEPREIAAALHMHPDIQSAVVTANEDGAAGKQLTAYVVPSKHVTPEQQEIRRYLRQRLPNYMIPNRFVFVDSIPLTPSGKVDRRALPQPEADGRADRPVRELLEVRLTQIWGRSFARPTYRGHGQFLSPRRRFAAGRAAHASTGTCLRRARLAVHLSRRSDHQEPGSRAGQAADRIGPLLDGARASGSDKPPFFYLHGNVIHGGFYCVNLARYLGEDRPFYALAPHGLNGTSTPPTVEAMAASFIEMIRSVQPRGPYFLGGICNGGVIAYEMARQLEERGERGGLVFVIAARARIEAHRARCALSSIAWETHWL